jgi:hypothetical protein
VRASFKHELDRKIAACRFRDRSASFRIEESGHHHDLSLPSGLEEEDEEEDEEEVDEATNDKNFGAIQMTLV